MIRRLTVVTVFAVAALVAGAVPAQASTALPANTTVVTGTSDSYGFGTALPYWSAVAVRPGAGTDFDLRLSDAGTGTLLASSLWGVGQTDVIAVNSNAGYRPLGSYLARVSQYSGTGSYAVSFFEKRLVMPVPTDPVGSTSTAWGINHSQTVTATQIYLQPGQGFRVYTGDSVRVFLAGSTPGAPATAVRTRSQLENAYVVADHVPAGNGAWCRVFVAPSAGWYSMILIWNSPWAPPPYNGGNAVFPQRYNPALGDTLTDCPVPQVP